MPVYVHKDKEASERVEHEGQTFRAGDLRHLEPDCPLFLRSLRKRSDPMYARVRNTPKVREQTRKCPVCWRPYPSASLKSEIRLNGDQAATKKRVTSEHARAATTVKPIAPIALGTAPRVARPARRGGGLTGTAGEYLVAAELSLRGWLATVTIKNAPGTDVLAPSGGTASIQVKTTSKQAGRFILSSKDEALAVGPDEWYVFVVLRPLGFRADFYIVPRQVVSSSLYCVYREWHSQPDKEGRPRKHVTTRDVNAANLGGYRENWSLLERPASEAPFLGPAWWLDFAAKWPRTEGYPGFE